MERYHARLQRVQQLQKRQRVVTVPQQRDILRVVYQLKVEHAEQRQKYGKNRKLPASLRNAQFGVHEAARLLGRSHSTIQDIVTAFEATGDVLDEAAAGNSKAKPKRLHSPATVIAARDFIRSNLQRQSFATSQHVMKHLVEKGFMQQSDSINGDIRAVQRFLARNGFKYGSIRGHKTWEEKQKLIDERTSYIRTLLENRNALIHLRRREVYLDESYVHHHHQMQKSWHDPSNPAGFRVAQGGVRLCFIGAIEGPNPCVTRGTREPSDEARLVPNSYHGFWANKSGDYHKNFNGKVFLDWVEHKLLANLPPEEPCIFIMDNAKYHKTKADGLPQWAKMKKDDALQWLKANAPQCNAEPWWSADALKTQVREEIAKRPLAVEQLLHKHNKDHQLLFTPPYHSDLQPIELLWAWVKGDIRKQHDNTTTTKHVETRTIQGFAGVAQTGGPRIAKLINHSFKVALKFWNADDEDDEYQKPADDTFDYVPAADAKEDHDDVPELDDEWDSSAESVGDSDSGEDSDEDDDSDDADDGSGNNGEHDSDNDMIM